jgi:D-threo-aldose 1-dehydrogenase
MSSVVEPHPMERRRLGASDVELTTLGLGGAAIGNLHRPVAPGVAAAVLSDAWAMGVRYFDTAPLYGRGLGEMRTRTALRGRPRDAYVLSTKVGWRLSTLERETVRVDADDPPYALQCDYSRDGTLRSVEDSLLRLGADRIDMLLVHDVDPYNHGMDGYRERVREVLDGALPALHELKRAGAVRAIGIAVNDCSVCLEFLRHAEVDAFLLAGRYTLLDQQAAEELLPRCLRRGVGVIVGAPFNSGVLATGATAGARFNYRALDPSTRECVEQLGDLCEAHSVSLMGAALQFPLRHPCVASVLAGPRSAEQLRGIATAFDEEIPDSLWVALAECGLISAVAAGGASPLTTAPLAPERPPPCSSK